MIELSLDFDKADIAAFQTQMNRLINELGTAPKDAVRQGSLALLKALRASTRKSKKTRKVTVSRSGRNRRVEGKRIFNVERWVEDKQVTSTIFADSLAEAKKHPLARIRYSKLAWASWGWSMQRLFPNSPAPLVMFREPRNALAVSETGTGRDFTVTIENKLGYISKAFNSGKGPAVATAMRRAANTMKGRIDQRLKGKLA